MKISALLAAAVILLPAAPALAEGHAWQVGNDSFHLILSDIDMHTVAGRAEALTRVEAAAVKLCGLTGVRSEQRACVATTVAQVARRSASPLLQQAMAERAGTAITLAQRN